MGNYRPDNLDVVWCAFPYAQNATFKPGDKARPCLVIGRELNIVRPDDEFVYVAYGTSQISKPAKYRVLVDDPLSMKDAGLWHPTLFRIDQVALLPFNKEFFPLIPAPASLDHKPKTSCRMGVFNERCRRSLIATFKDMKNDGIDLDDFLFAAKKQTHKMRL